MKITILGSGSSGGVPLIGNYWGECDPNNPKNIRTRVSVLVTLDNKRLKDEFNIIYSDSEKNSTKKIIESDEGRITEGYLKLKFDYKDGYLPRSIVSFYH